MSVELIVPTLGESITEATVSKWLKNIGDNFNEDEPLVEIETDKITVEVSAPKAGALSEIKVQVGEDVKRNSKKSTTTTLAKMATSKRAATTQPMSSAKARRTNIVA